MRVLRWYLRVSLVRRVIAGLLAGAAVGALLWYISESCGARAQVRQAMRYCSPFGTVFINLLKMIVVPTIFFSLVRGASSLPLRRLGRARRL